MKFLNTPPFSLTVFLQAAVAETIESEVIEVEGVRILAATPQALPEGWKPFHVQTGIQT